MTRPPLKKTTIAGGALLVLGACGVLRLVFPTGGAVFSHVEHLEKGAECKDCHGEAMDREKPAMPAMAVCNDCHDDLDKDKPPERHASIFVPEGRTEPIWSRVTALADEVIFDHALHVKEKVACADCHIGIEGNTEVSTAVAVGMEACVKCHATQAKEDNDCASCHRERRRDVPPPDHRGLWARRHGPVAQGAGGYLAASRCAICHTEEGCTACHQENAPRDHTGQWRHQAHGIASALDRERCAVCHTTDTCHRCHQEAAPRSHRGSWGGTASNHCYTCHAAGNDQGCAVCHKGTPSHVLLAAGKPADHTPGMNCRQCHTPASLAGLPHADNGMECNACHK
jgi:hypothetical protein